MNGDPRAPADGADDHGDAADVLRLDDALKLAGVAATGGLAKHLIQSGAVRVNGEVETRRKRKLVEGDVVEVGDERFEIALADDDEAGDDDADDLAAAGDGEAHAHGGDDRHDGRDGGDEDTDDDTSFDDEDDDAARLSAVELERWAAWIVDRMADDDAAAVIVRLGSLHPDALEAVFARLPSDVEDAVLDALDEVLERDADEDGDVFGRGEGPLQA